MILYGKHILVRHSIAAFQRRAEADMRFKALCAADATKQLLSQS